MQNLLHVMTLGLVIYFTGCHSSPNIVELLRCISEDDVVSLQRHLDNGLNADIAIDPQRPDMTILHYASSFDAEKSIRSLVRAGADIDRKTESSVTPLLAAITAKNTKSTLALIELGADVNSANHVGARPLHFAAAGMDLAIAKALLEHGADPNAKTTKNGGTPLSAAVHADSLELVRFLLKHGADPSRTDNSGKTPSHYAKSEALTELLHSFEHSNASGVHK